MIARRRSSTRPTWPASSLAVALCELRDGRLLAWGALLAVVVLAVFGFVTAIIPNPVFGRSVAPEPFAIAVWLLSAPLAGLLWATYLVPGGPGAVPTVLGASGRTGTTTGTIGSAAAFIAIGCPMCNKVALVLLGASGTMTVFAPLQPLIGFLSVALLAGTLAWRLRVRSRGGACPVAT
jgi:hypothetical protein